MNRSVQQPAASPRRPFVPWLAVLVWAALIFYFSAQPSLSTHLGIWDIILRKTAHMVEFGVLSLLVWRAIRQHGIPETRALAAGAAFSLLYAFSDEFHQRYVSGRSATLRDVGFDLAGIIVAVVTISIIRARNRSRATAG